MKNNFRNETQFLTDVAQIANDPKDYKHPFKLIRDFCDGRMSDLNYIPFDWKRQRKLTHKAVKNHDLHSVFF